MTILKKSIILILLNSISIIASAYTLDKPKNNSSGNSNLTCYRYLNLTDSLLNDKPCCQYQLRCKTNSLNDTIVISYGDGSPNDTVKTPNITNVMNWIHTYCNPGSYLVTLHLSYSCMDQRIHLFDTLTVSATCALPLPPPPCYDCISSFAPSPGKKYILSAWTKEKTPPQSKTSYTYPSIDILYPSISGSAGPFLPSGSIIDGWQRIEGEFVIPSSATNITIKLNCSTGDCYYDDVRMLPFDGTMKSYVYDPVNMRLVAELDERNYATLYEYDEEGKLIRVKKETEKGKMTIKENRDNSKK